MKKYNLGIKVLFYKDCITGAINFWPLSEKVAQSLNNRVNNCVFEECELEPLSVQTCKKSGCRFWYIRGFYLHKSLQNKGLKAGFGRSLLFRSFTMWIGGDEASFIDPLRKGVEILAIPTNPSVVSTLKKFEFQSEPGKTLDGYPLYKRSFALKKAADWLSYASFS